MAAADFTELMLVRAAESGRCDDALAAAFLERLYPGHGGEVFAKRAGRLANLTVIRPACGFRKRPDEQPWVSGPPSVIDVAGG